MYGLQLEMANLGYMLHSFTSRVDTAVSIPLLDISQKVAHACLSRGLQCENQLSCGVVAHGVWCNVHNAVLA